MPPAQQVTTSRDGVTFRIFQGAGATLLAFDLDEDLTPHLAGFSIKCTPPNGRAFYLLNRLSFETPIVSSTTPQNRVFTPSYTAPFQKFRWTHFPADLGLGRFTYELSPMYFTGTGNRLRQGPIVEASIDVDEGPGEFNNFRLGFTRGYLSSQAYTRRFHNAAITPARQTVDFDTAPFEERYKWLGFQARELIFDFLEECEADPDTTVDVFAYDLNEPDFIRALAKFGPRLRLFLDNAALHSGSSAIEPKAHVLLAQSVGAENVKVGHFSRYAHDKVLIQKQNGTPTRVLTGSANFSVRGLYVQANNVLVFNDRNVAKLYEDAFNQAFTDMSGFARSTIASRWFDISARNLPDAQVSFAPHADPATSIDVVKQTIEGARSSVIYAVMEIGGGGGALDAIRNLDNRGDVFFYGMTQSERGLRVYRPNTKTGIFASFAYLKDRVPPPFEKEWSGGGGQVIHHKFVVTDFNAANPIVFTGSSNLAAGGEHENGDNLLMIRDRDIATVFAVEGLRLVDHYHFRAAMKGATRADPLLLKQDADRWWAPYFKSGSARFRDRTLFVG